MVTFDSVTVFNPCEQQTLSFLAGSWKKDLKSRCFRNNCMICISPLKEGKSAWSAPDSYPPLLDINHLSTQSTVSSTKHTCVHLGLIQKHGLLFYD